MITCIIIDDEPHAVEQLTRHVQQTPGLQLLFSTTRPAYGLQQMRSTPADLVFLDVQMPELTGFDFIKAAPGQPQFILCTAYREYAVDGFNHNVVDYLLKPVSYARFMVATQKAMDRIAARPVLENTGFIFIKGDAKHRQVKIDLEAIECAEALGGYVHLYLTGKKKQLTAQSLKELEQQLPAPQFMRIHNSYIVAVKQIDHIDANEIKLYNGKTITIGASYKAAVQQLIKKNKK
jgi:two-component system, LytTR family, response regulator